MDRAEITNFIDWGSRDSHLMLNPHWPRELKKDLSISALPVIREHIWIGSSGTSGASQNRPSIKLIAASKPAFLISADAVNSHIKASSKDIWLNVLPKFHVGGLSIFARAHLSGSIVFDHSYEPWTAAGFHEWANQSQATLTSLVPTQLYDLVQLNKTAPTLLRVVFVGGANLDLDLYMKARELNYPVLPTFGMTECCSQIATATLDSLKSRKSVLPELQILSHVEAKTYENHRLAIQSPALFTAQTYWYGSESDIVTETLWRVGSWYTTSDCAEVKVKKPRPILSPKGRNTDEIKISGELINLKELREVLVKMVEPSVSPSDYYLLALPDVRRGFELALIYRQTRASQVETWIHKFNSQVLPVAKIGSYYGVKDFPRTELNKVKESELLKLLGFTDLHLTHS